MRVAVIPMVFPVVSETFVVNIVTGLIDRQHDVEILPLYRLKGDQRTVHPLIKKYRLFDRTIDPPAIEFNKKFFHVPLALRWPWFLQRTPYDIVHFQFGEAALRFLPLQRVRAFQGKWVVSFRGFDISSFILQHGEHVYDEVFKRGDLFLSNSEFFRQRLISLGCDERKTFVYRSGIDCDKFVFTTRRPLAGQPIKIVTVSRLIEKKGVEYGVRAVSELLKSGFNIGYEIVGDGPLKIQIQELIDELHVGDKIKLLGAQDQHGVIQILNKAHIFISPSVTARNGDQNGPDNTIKEAMAMGLPVVASRTAAIPEVVIDGKTGFLVDERDVKGIASKIQYLIDHPEVWPGITQTARSFIEREFNLEKLNDELVRHYQKLWIYHAKK